jgi:hypothetical protein
MQPGNFTFLEKRAPRLTFEQYPVEPPTNRFKRLWWEWFGKKYALREVLELLGREPGRERAWSRSFKRTALSLP